MRVRFEDNSQRDFSGNSQYQYVFEGLFLSLGLTLLTGGKRARGVLSPPRPRQRRAGMWVGPQVDVVLQTGTVFREEGVLFHAAHV